MFTKSLTVGAFLLSCTIIAGCGQTPVGPARQTNAAKESDNHASWWCVEHGIPEEICAQCSNKLAAQFKAKGDWCKEHDVPDSQCFACHPDIEEKFAAQYEAKYGKRPPKPEGG